MVLSPSHSSVALKLAIGNVSTVIVIVVSPIHKLISVTVRVTLYIPACAYR